LLFNPIYDDLGTFGTPLAVILSNTQNMKGKVIGMGAIILGIIYVISPIDLIPEAIPFFGVIDDAAVISMVIWGFNKIRKSKKEQVV